MRHGPKACWLMTTFQNPLGSLMPEAKKRDFVALLARHGLPLIEDDVYAELYFGDRRPLPAKAFDHAGLGAALQLVSKCLAPGYRLGWAAPGRFTQAVARQKLTTTLGASAPVQAGLAALPARGVATTSTCAACAATLATRKARMIEAVGRHFPPGTRATQPEGGYFIWVELPVGCDTLVLHRWALQQGVSVAPGPIFSASRNFSPLPAAELRPGMECPHRAGTGHPGTTAPIPCVGVA